MIGAFFKKIGLSIMVLCSSVSSLFHKNKSKKEKIQEPVHTEQMVDLKINTTPEEVVIEPIPCPPVVEPVIEKTADELMYDIKVEITRLKKTERSLKEKRKEEEYKLWKLEQKKVMAEIDEYIAKQSKEQEVWKGSDELFLSDAKVRALLPDSLDVREVKSWDEPNDIFA